VRGRVHNWLFGLLLRMCERLDPPAVGAASGSGVTVTIGWSASSVPSVSGRSVYPFLVLVIGRGREKFYTTVSPAQAFKLCAGGEQLVKDQMIRFGHTHPLDWDTNGSKFNFIEE
jgi:hypothetical protein